MKRHQTMAQDKTPNAIQTEHVLIQMLNVSAATASVNSDSSTAKPSVVSHITSASFKPLSQLRFDYGTTTIRRCHDAVDYDGSDRNYDLRSIRLRRKIGMFIFCSRRIATNGSRRVRCVVVGS